MPGEEGWAALFEPRGVIVAGVSPHPGRFGTVALHNILAHGYAGAVYATSRAGGSVLGVEAVRSVEELPHGCADLLLACTPASMNGALLRAAAAKGVRVAFVVTAGYGEAGAEGRALERELAAVARECGLLLAGPNGQGLVSTPVSLCAQIVAPYPPAGGIAVAGQSGNLTSAFCNYALAAGAGISRAVSAGNAAAVGVLDYLEYFAEDAATSVSLAYLEGLGASGAGAGGSGAGGSGAGLRFLARARALSARKPLVVLKGGASAGGQRAAASHTGSLASNERIFDAACRQAGIVRERTVEEAYETAATFATQPLPRGPNVLVLTTAGGWGVLTADAVAAAGLRLLALPDDLVSAIDRMLPPRWSGGNPVDTAAGERRDTVPDLLGLVAAQPQVDAVVFLGIGIQSHQAALLRRGPFGEQEEVARIIAYHERQDRRYAAAAAAVSAASGKPVLVASELAATQPQNPGPAAVRASGRICYPSGPRAVRALGRLWGYARWREGGR